MRTETDEFETKGHEDIQAIANEGLIYICFGIYASEKMDIDQAREFFKQGLEMCGEPEAAEQPDFKFVKESECE